MTTETKEIKLTFEDLFADLDKELQDCKPMVQNFEKAIKMLSDYSIELQEKLEYATILRKDDMILHNLYYSLAGYNASNLVDKLRSLGFSLRRNKLLKEAFEKAGYRLLEQTRAARRDDVYYGILRIFMSAKEEMRKILIEPFKSIYSDEMFKIFVFSFLSGVLQTKENEQ